MPVSILNRPAATFTKPAVGRFAPSPTGALHLGSLTTAIASYCHIKSIGGRWLLRIEDTDHQRCLPEFSHQILLDLERLGLHWDGEVWYQSQREAIYNELLEDTLLPRVYGCQCSRKQLAGHEIYPRYCLPEASLRRHVDQKSQSLAGKKVRIELPDYSIGFLDGIQGMQWANPQRSLGDVVLRRADGTINYFLAASVDDGLQGITHVMRGLDILPLTSAQIAIMQYLTLPAVAHWYHLPLVENQYGQKLSKQNLATPIDTSSKHHCQRLIQHALLLLKQPEVEIDTPELMLKQATQQWQHTPLHNQSRLGRSS